MRQALGSEGSFDDVMEALRDSDRRRLLLALEAQPPGHEQSVSLSDVTDEDDEKQTIKFHHCHLPKLVGDGYVEWQAGQSDVHVGPAFDEIRPLLELIRENESELPDGIV